MRARKRLWRHAIWRQTARYDVDAYREFHYQVTQSRYKTQRPSK